MMAVRRRTAERLTMLTLSLSLCSAYAGVSPTIRASATPPQLTIEYGGDVVVTGSLSNALRGAHESSTCILTRLYASGGYGLTMEKLSPDFKKCCNLTVPATSINASAITCHIPAGVVATEGNTTITTAVGTAFIRHIAAFVPEFSRRPFVREAEGGVVVRLARSLNAATIQVQIPCGGPLVNASLGGSAHDDGLSRFVHRRVSFPLSVVSVPCYEAVLITLQAEGVGPVTRNRTFIRAAAPQPAGRSCATAWQVDHESKGLLVDGRRFLAQGWFAGGYSHESVGLPPMSQVPAGSSMPAGLLNKLGQASLVTEWGRNQHSFVRYGIGAAQVVAGSPQQAHLLEVLDAAAAAGVYVLIDLGVDRLALTRLGRPNNLNLTADELWADMKGNISLVKNHPAVGAYYGCDDCCHMDVIKEHGMGEMQEIARIKRAIFDLDPHHLIWGSIACRELWMWSDESGNGLGLDVTMKEAYFSGVGSTGLTDDAPAAQRSEQSVSTLRDFPMTMHALVDMPSTGMVTAAMMRSRIYNALCQQAAPG